jgi:protein-S-isoprenylcysteine O-methyltransferase Ste14
MDDRTAALLRQAWPRQLIFVVFLALLLFAPAGRLRFWQAWLFLAVVIGCTVATGLYFVKRDPALVERRMKAGPAAEQEPAQKLIVTLMIAGFLLLVLVSAFDRRWHWSAEPAWLAVLADIGIVASFLVFLVVMEQNSYAASTVRVEKDQPLISTGLYGVVRHPMYSGALLTAVCIPLALGSYWSLPLVLVVVPLLAWRLLDEERVLKRDLPGYAAYCQRVRWRLVPGVW